jgi:hypothetical protein
MRSKTILDFLRDGDVLMVTRIDRLARSIGDLQDIVRAVRARGAVPKATEQPIDTSTAAGKCFLNMLSVFAEFETNLRRERHLEGIAKAKAAGGQLRRAAGAVAPTVENGDCAMKSGAPFKIRGRVRLSVFFPQAELSIYCRHRGAKMTRNEFLSLHTAVALPIVLADGRVGLCNHWTATEIVVDVYGDGSHAIETERVRFADVVTRGGGLAVSPIC